MSSTTPPPGPSAPPTGPAQLLAALRRRWWLVLITACVGAAVGFLLYTTRPPVYRSDAKLRVLRRDAARSINDVRGGYVDDYVNSQQETIQSGYILAPAASSQTMKAASAPFRAQFEGDDPNAASDALRAGLSVTRGKDTSAGLGNSILELSFTAGNPRDAKIALEAIIETFKADLETKSDDTINVALNEVHREIVDLREAITGLQNQRAEKTALRFNITSEDPQSLAARWATGSDEVAEMDRQLLEVNSTLDLLKTAKTNYRDRIRLVEIITNSRANAGETAASTLDGQKRLLDLKIKQLGERLGKDHPEMQEALVQREYIVSELARLNPDNPTGEADDLALLRAQMERKKITLEAQRTALNERVMKAENDLKQVRPVLAEIDQIDFEIGKLKEQKAIKEVEFRQLQSAQETSQEQSGIEATELSQPRDGMKVGPVLITWLFPLAFAGAALGGGLALLLELRDQRFRSPAEVRERLRLAVVGHLPAIRTDRPAEAEAPAGFEPTLVTAVRPRSAEAEAFRGLRTQVLRSAEADDLRVIQVTSPSPGDGKSTLAANLAISLAQAGKDVVLIDADLRKPRVHAVLGLSGDEPGLAAAIDGRADVFEVVRETAVERLRAIPCGPRPDSPAELLSAPAFRDVLSALRGRFDYVIVDTPPLLAVSDPRVVAQRVDAVILTLRLSTNRSDGERATEMLTDLGVNVLGVAVNATRPQEGYGYGYRYDYQYSAEGYTG